MLTLTHAKGAAGRGKAIGLQCLRGWGLVLAGPGAKGEAGKGHPRGQLLLGTGKQK